MKHLAILFATTAAFTGSALACPNSEHQGKTAETSEAPKQTAEGTPAAADKAPAAKPAPAKPAPAKPAPAKADKVSSK
jgi:hypothetical protein